MRGFTLPEILITLGVAVIIGVLLLAILVNNNIIFYKQSAIVSEGLDLNDATREISSNIQQAAKIADGYPEDTSTFTTSSTTLVLKLPSLGVSGVIDNTYDFVVIAKDVSNPKILRLQTFPDAQSTRHQVNQVLTTLLQEIQFKYLDKDNAEVPFASAVSVETTLTVLAKTGFVTSNRTSTQVTTLRNL